MHPLMVAKVDTFYDDSGTSLSKMEYSDMANHESLQVTVNLSSKLVFIQYNPDNTLCRQWCVIQVDMGSTKLVNPKYSDNEQFWCVLYNMGTI